MLSTVYNVFSVVLTVRSAEPVWNEGCTSQPRAPLIDLWKLSVSRQDSNANEAPPLDLCFVD